ARQVGRFYENDHLYLKLAERTAQIEAAENRLRLQYAVSRALAASVTTGDAAQAVLRVVCEGAGFIYGAMLERNDGVDTLRIRDIWHADKAVASEGMQLARDIRVPRGGTMVGRAWAEGKVQWVPTAAGSISIDKLPASVLPAIASACVIPLIFNA